ncbi:MAG: DUF1385 domain-containing protein [Candidatus Bipolaricaulis anaerobius]|jgi:uncharacterized protein YqhQ|uniref:DUF1385 domain-containing protein n=1 Tax=Candidatus Bipolaricaulis anaerobius TaxID=2026885 RepID=A0A2X3L2F5_9BACT|nr:DUF1385 domain-containing protein [Candidatus Bipolaricaulis anaerobius]MBP7726343.1 DUF1385 domain-containing protein [Candidatus Bipolaricaulis sp.]MDD2912884.1 DUF1385 domain-containing protein [Candidatus Bipolaricaulis anaerobius]MDD5764068.1 DUF1385 domain-containing protein [Candidatus Bipolaricaulis anaerobius]SQD93329.1 conserved membrane protein of unknown function [Candidatus Bipolaricaulis anaerobius]
MPIGGQAVIEGVMLQDGPRVAMAVRTPDGPIAVEPLPNRFAVPRLEGIPFVRGPIKLVQMLALGWEALSRSAELAYPAEAPASRWESLLVIVLVVVILVGGFMLLPAYLTGLTGIENRILFNLVEGGIRVALFLGYLAAISFLSDIRRVFQYHGAEHKVVHSYEEGVASVPDARGRSPIHPRCGTSFLLLFVVVAILVFSLLPTSNVWIRLGGRLLLLPVVASLTYEILRFGSRHPRAWWLQPLLAPGLLLQRFTTRDPSDDQIEVAFAALRYLTDEDARSSSTTGA